MINELVKLNEEKIKSITLFEENEKTEIMESIKFTKIPYFPITKGFIENYILNNQEYPLVESKISQAATELNSRVQKIIDLDYQYNKSLIELEELKLDIEELECSAPGNTFDEKRKQLELQKKQLDLQMKQYAFKNLINSIKSTTKEIINWKQTIDDMMKIIQEKYPEMTIDDINFDGIREVEMKIKIQRWMEKYQKGEEVTASQRVFVDEGMESLKAKNNS